MRRSEINGTVFNSQKMHHHKKNQCHSGNEHGGRAEFLMSFTKGNRIVHGAWEFVFQTDTNGKADMHKEDEKQAQLNRNDQGMRNQVMAIGIKRLLPLKK